MLWQKVLLGNICQVKMMGIVCSSSGWVNFMRPQHLQNENEIEGRQIGWTAFGHLEISEEPKIGRTEFLHINHLPFDGWGLLTAHSAYYSSIHLHTD